MNLREIIADECTVREKRRRAAYALSSFALAEHESEPMAFGPGDRTPCPFCGVRGDKGCSHRPAGEPVRPFVSVRFSGEALGRSAPPPAPVGALRPPEIRKRPRPVSRYTPMPKMRDIPAPAIRIINEVARAFEIKPEQLVERNRGRRFFIARAVAYRLMRDRWRGTQACPYSTPGIGRWFARDHSTIVHGLRRFDHYLKDPFVAQVYAELAPLGRRA